MVRIKPQFCVCLVLVLPAFAATAPSVTVAPSNASVRAGATKQFTASLKSVTGPVMWSINGVAGGNATVGTITSGGVYTAPATNPSVALTVGASAGNPAVTGSAMVTWLNPEPSITSFNPTQVNIGTFPVTVTGKNFVAGAKVSLNGSPVTTNVVSSTSLTFQATITTPETVSVTVSNPDPGASTSSARSLTINPPVKVTMAAQTSVRLETTHKFSATVANTPTKAVTWSVNGIAGGSPVIGTIATDGTYTAPATIPAGGAVTIRYFDR